MYSDVVRVEGDPVAAEGDDGVRADVVDELTGEGVAAIFMKVEGAVGQAKETVVVNPEHRHRRCRLPATHPSQTLR